MTRLRLWREHSHRTLHTAEGPLVVPPGKVVLVAICDTWEQASRAAAQLDEPACEREKEQR